MSCHKNKTNKTFGHLQIATPFKDTAVSVVVGLKIVESSGCTRGTLDTCSQPSLGHSLVRIGGPFLACDWISFRSIKGPWFWFRKADANTIMISSSTVRSHALPTTVFIFNETSTVFSLSTVFS